MRTSSPQTLTYTYHHPSNTSYSTVSKTNNAHISQSDRHPRQSSLPNPMVVTIPNNQIPRKNSLPLLTIVENTNEQQIPTVVQSLVEQLSSGSQVFCAVCFSAATFLCSGCRKVFYCTIKCQKNHWLARHHQECQ